MATEDKKPNVSTPNAAHQRMVELSELPRTLLGGTEAMRKAGKTYLPQEPKESPTAYNNRLNRTFLFNKYGITIEEMVGRLFKNGVKLEKVPPIIEEMLEDADLTGRDLRRFSRDLFESALQPGVDYILVDFPPAPEPVDGEQPKVRSLADEKALGLRPFLVHIPQRNLISWRTEVINGVETLVRVQLAEIVEEDDGDWGVKEIEQVRVLYRGSWETYRKDESDEWCVHNSGLTTLDFIPLIPFYTKRTGFMIGEPPLRKLAELNQAHWQSASDQRNILHVARVPILFGAGFSAENGTVEIGPSTMVTNTDPTARLTYVEHTGKAIEAGAKDLSELENQMQLCAMEPLVPKTGVATATAKAIDTAQSTAMLSAMGEDLSDCLEQAIKFMLAWMGTPDLDPGCVDFEPDMSNIFGQQADLDALDKARARKDISRTAFVAELQRRKVLGEEYDVEADQALIDEEGPALGELGQGGADLPQEGLDQGDKKSGGQNANDATDK
jgi:hypothetical protein